MLYEVITLLKIQTRTSRRMETVLGQLNDYIEALRVLESYNFV